MVNLDRPSVTVYPPNPNGTIDEAPISTIEGSDSNFVNPVGLAVDASGNAYVAANTLSTYSIEVFAPNAAGTHNAAPIATITGSNTGLDVPAGVALDRFGRVYVSGLATGLGTASIDVYPANPRGTLNEAPIATISGSLTFLSGAIGLCVDASGKIYVADGQGSVLVFPAIPSAGGPLNESPLAVLSGPTSGLKEPYGIALDASGKIYVVDAQGSSSGVGSIDVFAANPSGFVDEAPLATISGPNAGLAGPAFIALDPSGRIYVTDPSLASIFVFGADPVGALDEPPVATIAGKNTGLLAPYGIVVP